MDGWRFEEMGKVWPRTWNLPEVHGASHNAAGLISSPCFDAP
jgi:hypothetical protein